MRLAILVLAVACGGAPSTQQPANSPPAARRHSAYDGKASVNEKEMIAMGAVTIVGTVRDPDGKPAHDVRVYHPPFDDLGVREIDEPVDANGEFVLRPMRAASGPVGSFWITARRADGAVRSQKLDITKPGVIRVALALLPPSDPRVLHIVVVDATGRPVAGAHVMVEDQMAKTDASGKTSMDYDTSITGGKNLTARVNKTSGWARGMTKVDVPRSSPLTISVDE